MSCLPRPGHRPRCYQPRRPSPGRPSSVATSVSLTSHTSHLGLAIAGSSFNSAILGCDHVAPMYGSSWLVPVPSVFTQWAGKPAFCLLSISASDPSAGEGPNCTHQISAEVSQGRSSNDVPQLQDTTPGDVQGTGGRVASQGTHKGSKYMTAAGWGRTTSRRRRRGYTVSRERERKREERDHREMRCEPSLPGRERWVQSSHRAWRNGEARKLDIV